MKNIQKITVLSMALAVGVSAATPASAFTLNLANDPKTSTTDAGTASDQATTASAPAAPATTITTMADVDKVFAAYRAKYTDIAGTFSGADFRTAGEQAVLNKVNWNGSDTISKLYTLKKKLDQLQARNRESMELTSVEVGPNQMPRLYKLASKAAAALEFSQNFHVFVVASPEFNAYTYSYRADDFDVVVYSGAIENLTDDGILALFGHEMGHVKDQAILSQVILSVDFENRNKDTSSAAHQAFYDKLLNEMPMSLRTAIARTAAQMAADNNVIMGFDNDAQASAFTRNCELTADRAAVIVTGDAQAPLKLLATLAYGSRLLTPELNIDQLIKQIKSVLDSTDSPDDVDYLVQNEGSHPFNVLRLIEVGDYADSDAFKALKARQLEDSFAKELDVFVNALESYGQTSKDFKKYLDEKADSDDSLVRLKTKDQYNSRLKRLQDGATDVAELILGEVMTSGLNSPQDALFDEFISKMKDDKTEALKSMLAPPAADAIKKALDTAKGADATELNTKLKQLQSQIELK